MKVYAAAPAARLKANVPSFNFTVDDIIAMQQLCGYETVIRNSSDFCSLDLFTPEEWLGFEYTSEFLRYLIYISVINISIQMISCISKLPESSISFTTDLKCHVILLLSFSYNIGAIILEVRIFSYQY